MRISDCSSDVCSSDLGAVSAFIIALFTEMYGFPLTIYLLSGWLQSRYPGVDWSTHDAGHLLEELFGWRGNPHFGPFHLLSFAFIGGGFILIASARSEEHTSELQSLMRISYAVFCLKK